MKKEGIKKCLCFRCPKAHTCPVGEQVITVKGEIVVSECKYNKKP